MTGHELTIWMANPVSASTIRKFVPFPRVPVASLDEHPRHVRLLESRAKSAGRKPALASTRPEVSTITYSRPAIVTIRRRHDALVLPIETRLRTNGWSQTPFNINPYKVDLAMAKGANIVLAEIKTVSGSSFPAVREAFAQLHHYAWRYIRRHPNDQRNLYQWAVLEKEPSPEDVNFLEDSSIMVTWASVGAKRMIHGPKTRERLRRLSIDP